MNSQIRLSQQVKLGFLPVGHTHEDIDQLFSCVSRHLKHRNALTIPGLHRCFVYICNGVSYIYFFAIELTQAIQASVEPQPIIEVLHSVVDTKGWMKNQTQALHDHLKAHQFKFEQNQRGECRMFYKEWSTDSFWLPQTGLSLLPVPNSVPTLPPLVLRPCFDPEHLAKLEATLKKIGGYLDKAGAAAWWSSWLDEARKYTEPAEPQPMEGTRLHTPRFVYLIFTQYNHSVSQYCISFTSELRYPQVTVTVQCIVIV